MAMARQKIMYISNCPSCGLDFNDGDIYEVIAQTFPDKNHEELLEYCSHYGWTPENKKNFSKIINVKELGYGNFWQCPGCDWNDR